MQENLAEHGCGIANSATTKTNSVVSETEANRRHCRDQAFFWRPGRGRLPLRRAAILFLRLSQLESTCFLPVPMQERIPIWVAATWPRPRPFRRAAKYNGVAPVSPDLQGDLTVEQMREVCAFISKYRTSAAPFDIIEFGTTIGRSCEEDANKVAAFVEAGVTWWLEAPSPWELTIAQVRDRIRLGPPKI
jgi:hypothetical protein